MVYPDQIEEKLGFTAIRQWLADHCLSEPGRQAVAAIGWQSDPKQLAAGLKQVAAFRQMLVREALPAPAGTLTDTDPLLAQARKEGSLLPPEALHRIYVNLATARNWQAHIGRWQEEWPALATLPSLPPTLADLEEKLARSVTENGEVPDTASRELRRIRQQLRAEEGTLRQRVEQAFRQWKKEGYVPDGTTIGVRQGRLVVPVTAAYKRHVQGFIIDESATGSIVFMEPAAALEAGNRIREWQLAERREINRILEQLTTAVRTRAGDLQTANDLLARVDLLHSRSRLADTLQAEMPELSAERCRMLDLRHPLLALGAAAAGRQVVPHDIELDSRERFLLISGPNAGGKSVALKSVGLNQYMLQCGLLPCCRAGSQFRLFADIFIDIGDEQSIDNDLSTYSSHLRNMAVMLEKAGPGALVLIDEFGSGTDPAFGGAIAEAVLEALLKKGCLGIITTHFGNLKSFAEKQAGVVNAAMLFDSERLAPTYRLERGRPGSSFSLEVAARSGLPQEVVQAAEQKLSRGQLQVEKLLARLEAEKQQLEEQNRQLARQLQELKAAKEKYENLLHELEARKKTYLRQAREEAAALLARTNREIEKTIRHIKENQAEKKETRKARERLQRLAGEIGPEPIDRQAPAAPPPTDLQPGDRVLITDRDVEAVIQDISGKNARVAMGELLSVVPLSRLRRIGAARHTSSRPGSSNTAREMTRKMAAFSPVLDVRGMRASELLPALQRYLDEAVMLGQPEVKILHGKGNGVLRQLVRQELAQWPQVSGFDSEKPEQGGDGITVVRLA